MATNVVETKTKSSGSGSLIHRAGGAVKPLQAYKSSAEATTGWVEGYLVSWGNGEDTDLQGEHFTPRTEFCLEWFPDRPVLYHHGLDGQAGLRKIGSIKSIEADDLGLWVQAQLDLRDRYANAVYDMVKTKEFGWSSGSVDHLVKISTKGEITVWPIIEGSITPTPAQPSKTTVRAFKAILSEDSSTADYLRGLEARVDNSGYVRSAKSSLLIPSSYKQGLQNPGVDIEDNDMAKNASKRLARDYARAMGVKLSAKELNEVAAGMESKVDEEVANAAAEELETEAALAALEEEMVQETKTMRNRKVAPTRRATRRFKDDVTVADDVASQMEDELAAQLDDVAAEMADEIAAEMEDELATQMEETAMEKSAARAIRRRAWRRALRQITATDDVGADINMPAVEQGGQGAGYMGDLSADNPPVENFKRMSRRARRGYARRGYARRDGVPAPSNSALEGEEAALMADEDAAVVEEVAKAAFNNGFRKGLRRGFRTTDEVAAGDVGISENNDEAGNANLLGVSGGDITAASYRGRRASRNVARRGYARRDGTTPDAAVMEDAVDVVGNDPEALAAFRKGYMNAVRRARRDGLVTDEQPAAMFDEPEATMFDDATMDDTLLGGPAAASYRGRRSSRKSLDTNADYWKSRAMKAEMMEAPGQRRFGGVGQVTDSADRPGAYSGAFKAYLHKGLGLMTDQEKYVLTNKGRVDWSDAKGSFARTKSGAFKTYFGGSDASAGFAVPPDWVAELNKNIMTQTVMAPECRTRSTTSDRIVQPNLVTTDARRSHAAVVRWPGEVITAGSEHRTVEDTFSQVDVPIHVMLLSLTAGNSALEDVSFSLEDEINEAFSEAVAIAYDDLIWGGDGQGKLEGIVVNSNVTGARSTGVQSVSGYIPTGSPDGIVTADVLKEMLFHLPRGYRQRSKWYMNSNTALQIATLKDGEGNYLIDVRTESLQAAGVPERLLGKPIVINEYADDIAQDAFPIVLGDLSRGYLIGKRVDFSIRRFDDSQYAELDQVLFLGRARLGGQVLQQAALKVLKVSAT